MKTRGEQQSKHTNTHTPVTQTHTHTHTSTPTSCQIPPPQEKVEMHEMVCPFCPSDFIEKRAQKGKHKLSKPNKSKTTNSKKKQWGELDGLHHLFAHHTFHLCCHSMSFMFQFLLFSLHHLYFIHLLMLLISYCHLSSICLVTCFLYCHLCPFFHIAVIIWLLLFFYLLFFPSLLFSYYSYSSTFSLTKHLHKQICHHRNSGTKSTYHTRSTGGENQNYYASFYFSDINPRVII